MSHTTTTVVTRQVTSSGGTTHVTTGNRDWNTGVTACTENCKNCLFTCFCPLCAASSLAKRIGEHCCIPCCVPGALITMRTKIRLMLGIRGTICSDCIVSSCCALCTLCQMKRELDAAGWPK